jgi:hypothetical protein
MRTGTYLNKFHKLFIPGVICLAAISSWPFPCTVLATNEAAQKIESDPAQGPEKPTTNTMSGKVLETMDAKHYTYVLLKKDDTETWIAVPKMKVNVGEELEFWKGIEMNKFNSTQLNRTFDTIFFSAGLVSGTGPTDDDIVAMAHGGRSIEQISADKTEPTEEIETTEQSHTLDKNRQHDEELIQKAHGGQTLASLSTEKAPVLHTLAEPIEKASGPDGYQINEIYKNQRELAGKEVRVRGRVVKIASGILKMNWIHLQDGSGNVSSGTHDIIVTSNDLPVAGDIVTMRGTVHLNKDFGAGYKYALILMEGKKE